MNVNEQLIVYCECCGKKRTISLDSTIANSSYCEECSRIVEAECVICHQKGQTPYYNAVNGFICHSCIYRHEKTIRDTTKECQDVLEYLNSVEKPSIFRYSDLKTWLMGNDKFMNSVKDILKVMEDFPYETSRISVFSQLAKKVVLIRHETELFEFIQKQLQNDIKTENNQNLEYWENLLHILKNCKTSIEEENIRKECYFKEFPIARSCCNAIKELICDIEIRQCYKQEIEKKEKAESEIAENSNS